MVYGQQYKKSELFESLPPAFKKIDFHDFETSIDEMQYEGLIAYEMKPSPVRLENMRPVGGGISYVISLTIKGKKLKEKGGWIKAKKRRIFGHAANQITIYGTFVLALLGVFLQWYYSNPAPTNTNTSNKSEQVDESIPNENIFMDTVRTDSSTQLKEAPR